jgi:hypothetical protein
MYGTRHCAFRSLLVLIPMSVMPGTGMGGRSVFLSVRLAAALVLLAPTLKAADDHLFQNYVAPHLPLLDAPWNKDSLVAEEDTSLQVGDPVSVLQHPTDNAQHTATASGGEHSLKRER